MRISIIGTGYVGLVSAAGFSEKGHVVTCVDVVKDKIDMINSGRSPIYEKGLDAVLQKNAGKSIIATNDLTGAVMNSEVTFVCVGTPSKPDGSFDRTYVEKATEDIGKTLSGKKTYHTVVFKITLLPGTTYEKLIPLLEKHSGKKAGRDFGVATNPEFLREGIALEDVMNPDRIIIGGLDERSSDSVEKLYNGYNSPVIKTDITTAEMIKYSSNAFLAMKISFINEIGNICKRKGVNVYDVAVGMGLDHRIAPYFLNAGLGWGGSCFPKDLRALIYEARNIGYEPVLLDAALEVNKKLPHLLVEMARNKTGSLKDKKIAVLGLAFKRDTDDTRDSQSFLVIEELLEEGAKICAYDPKAEKNAKAFFRERIEYSPTVNEALKDANLALLLTDWKEFENIDFERMKNKIVIDGRNILKKRENIDYGGLHW